MIDSEFTIRKLEIFVSFMKTGNIARTAVELELSAVSVHRALHSLEETMRCALFFRQGRNLLPTPAAQTLEHYAKQMLLLTHDAIETTRRSAGYASGRLQLGCLYSLTNETVPALVVALKKRRSNLEINLTMDSNSHLLQMLDDGKIHAALIVINDKTKMSSDIETLPLFEDELCLAVSNDYYGHIEEPCDLKQFDGDRFVCLSEGFATTEDVKKTFQSASISPKIVTELDNIFSLMNMVQAGVGHAIVPSRIVSAFGRTVRFVRLVPHLANLQHIALVFKQNQQRNPDLLALIAQSRMMKREKQAEKYFS